MEDGIRRRNIGLRMPFCKDIYLRRQQTIQLFNIHTLRQIVGLEGAAIGGVHLALPAGENHAQVPGHFFGGVEVEHIGGLVLVLIVIVPVRWARGRAER